MNVNVKHNDASIDVNFSRNSICRNSVCRKGLPPDGQSHLTMIYFSSYGEFALQRWLTVYFATDAVEWYLSLRTTATR